MVPISYASATQSILCRVGGYAIITGQGRSGTNWLLGMVNASPATFCRNEPNAIPGSVFGRLPPMWNAEADTDDVARHWDAIVEHTLSHVGERDRPLPVDKKFLHGWSTRMGLPALMARPKLQRAAALALPPVRRGEWRLPRWAGDRTALAEAYGVIKINRVPLVTRWLLADRPEVPVINIVRHPGGRHASYLRRFLAHHDPTIELEKNREILSAIAAANAEWADTFGSIQGMTHVEVQTWLWRYITETVEHDAIGRPQYHRVVYEDLASDPLAQARGIYDTCGLAWTPDVEHTIESQLHDSNWGRLEGSAEDRAQAWRSQLEPEDQAAIARILKGSTVADWWE